MAYRGFSDFTEIWPDGAFIAGLVIKAENAWNDSGRPRVAMFLNYHLFP